MCRCSLLFIAFLIIGLGIFLILDFFGIIWHNTLFAAPYAVQGLDVSHYQGAIDWKHVAATKKYSFVFIKATEGHDFVDDTFLANWKGAQENGLLVGAYHFFSTRSSGQEQAEYFIATVPKEDHALPPVIDIEIGLDKNQEQVRNELRSLSSSLEQHYNKKPILYVTYDIHHVYVKGEFDDHHIWIRDILRHPTVEVWTFWQYSNRGRVEGIPALVDINAFRGSRTELQSLTQPET